MSTNYYCPHLFTFRHHCYETESKTGIVLHLQVVYWEPKPRSNFGIGAETFLSETETYVWFFSIF